MAPDAYSMYSTKVQGAFFVAFMLGSILGEVFMSGRLSDWIVGTMTKKNNNRNHALRLLLSYAAALMTGVGHALWGVSIDQEWHWMTGEVALFLGEWWFKASDPHKVANWLTLGTAGAGIQIGNTAISSFIVDLYPEHLMDVISFYSILFNVSHSFSSLHLYMSWLFQLASFIEPWFISNWVASSGNKTHIICFFGKILTPIYRIFLVLYRSRIDQFLWNDPGADIAPSLRNQMVTAHGVIWRQRYELN